MQKKPFALKWVSLEIFSIVFAVLLALMLDAWRERIKIEQKVQNALEDIVSEIDTFIGMDETIEFNTVQMDSLEAMIKRHRAGQEVHFVSGVARPEVRSLAWETSRASGIASDFERQIFVDITEIYVEFDRLEKILAYNREFGMKSDPSMPAVDKAIHRYRQLDGIIFRSQELQDRAREFLEKYKDAEFTQHLE
ncbi:MAG: hypothetical protein HEP71_15265 [Roseivirga sp.]|nr:hypothetical protein [Roseivirga sp.]